MGAYTFHTIYSEMPGLYAEIHSNSTTVSYGSSIAVRVDFDYDTASYALVYPNALIQLPITNIKKLFKLMCAEDGRNDKAIGITEDWLKALVVLKHKVWDWRSQAYQNGYKDTRYLMQLHNKSVIEANNKKLLNAVKRSKSEYEKAVRLEQYFKSLV